MTEICKHCGKKKEEHFGSKYFNEVYCVELEDFDNTDEFEPLENHNPKRISSLCVRDSQYKTEEGNGKAVNKAPNQNVKANDCSEQTSNTQREQKGEQTLSNSRASGGVTVQLGDSVVSDKSVPSETLADKGIDYRKEIYQRIVYDEKDIKTALKLLKEKGIKIKLSDSKNYSYLISDDDFKDVFGSLAKNEN